MSELASIDSNAAINQSLRPTMKKTFLYFVMVVLLVAISHQLLAQQVVPRAQNSETKPALSDTAQANYQRKLSQYVLERRKYDDLSKTYWDSITVKRRIRSQKRITNQAILLEDYVLTQPPVYSGPEKPIDPSASTPEAPQLKKYIPVVADFLKAALEQFQFIPLRPRNEMEYKRVYARTAAEAGLTKEQVVRVYAFESGGNGKYDVQAGLEYDRPGAQAVSSALGYNQLLGARTVGLLAEQGNQFISRLEKQSESLSGVQKNQLIDRLFAFRRMIEFSKSVPNKWSEHVSIAQTTRGLAVHAVLLDVDIGPLLQTHNLLYLVDYAKSKGRKETLTAAELEMMNLTGAGNGFDMITMTADMQAVVPTSNFFEQSGYVANPIAVENNVVAKLIAATNSKMDEESKLQGAVDLTAAFKE